jgi:hypothetical protein
MPGYTAPSVLTGPFGSGILRSCISVIIISYIQRILDIQAQDTSPTSESAQS